MRAWWILAQISTLVLKSSLADVCWPAPCSREPKVLRFRYHEMEIDASSVNVHEGDDISIICDGSCVDTNYNPYLRWYGPDRYWISSERKEDRINVERAHSLQFLKLHIKSMTKHDEGAYICRGRLGDEIGWRLKAIILYVVRKQRPFENLSAGSSKKDFPTPSPSTIKPIRSTRGRTTITTTVPSPKVVTKTTTTTRRTTDLTSSSSPTTTSSSTVSFQNLTTDIHINKVISIASSMPATEFKTERATMEPESLKNVTTAVPGEPVTKPEKEDLCQFPNGFQCDDGVCISINYRCDSVPDCENGEDELDCGTISGSV